MINKRIGFIVIFLVFFSSTFISYSYFKKGEIKLISPLGVYQPPSGNSNSIPVENNEPKTEICPLNGAKFSKGQRALWEKRRPLGVMIENHLDARPQSGLTKADVVYEAVAEGGITRFLAIFYCQDAPFIGPIRSARIYFIRLLQGYGNYPLYAHVGGANTPGPADALGEIRDLGWSGYNDLNQFSVPFPYYWRDYERLPDRAPEHTVYSSTTKLWLFAKEKRDLTNKDNDGVDWNKNFIQWQFTGDAKNEDRGNIKKINLGFWNSFASDYSVEWQYDRNTNEYKRFNGGQPHLDKNNGKQITAKNIGIVFAKESPANDGYEGGHILYQLIGSGQALVFQNGQVIKGSWKKNSEEENIRFFNQEGQEITFVGGPIWIEIQPIGNEVTY